MATCVVCGNDYEKSFKISLNNKQYDFDSFECAIMKLAPSCTHCNCKIIGHGVEEAGKYFCCNHCLEKNR